MLAHETNSMTVINHDESAVFISKIANRRKVCNKAIHGKYAIGCNQLDAAILCSFELSTEIVHIVVLITEPLGLAETYAVNDAGMVQFIGDNSIFLAEKRFKQTAVCIEAGAVKDTVICAYKIGKLALELLMNLLGSADKADGGKTEAPTIIAGFRSSDDIGIVGKTEVVVSTHVEHTVLSRGVYACLLRGSDYSLILVGACFTDGSKLIAENLICLFHNYNSFQ